MVGFRVQKPIYPTPLWEFLGGRGVDILEKFQQNMMGEMWENIQ